MRTPWQSRRLSVRNSVQTDIGHLRDKCIDLSNFQDSTTKATRDLEAQPGVNQHLLDTVHQHDDRSSSLEKALSSSGLCCHQQ